MSDLSTKDYIVVVQCDIVQQRCSGYYCEKAWHERAGGFAEYPKDKAYRVIHMTCGGCCGRALHRKLTNLVAARKKREGAGPEKIVVQLSSCITLDNHHGPPCPHLDYLKALIARAGLDVRMNTSISKKAEQRRSEGAYRKQAQ